MRTSELCLPTLEQLDLDRSLWRIPRKASSSYTTLSMSSSAGQ